jgi:hypothetical protein
VISALLARLIRIVDTCIMLTTVTIFCQNSVGSVELLNFGILLVGSVDLLASRTPLLGMSVFQEC